MKGSFISKQFNITLCAKDYHSMSTEALSYARKGTFEPFFNIKLKNPKYSNLTNKSSYNTYKSRVYNSGMYNNVSPNFANTNMHMNSGENFASQLSNNANYPSNISHYPSNNPNYKYDVPNNYYQSKYNSNINNESTDSNNTTYQYFSIFGSTAMCLIKPIFPDYIINKNKVTIYGKGGFQFVFMKKQNNSNKYDKNNKMSIFLKINNLSSVLCIKDVEKLKIPITMKGNNNNYLIIDKHKEKKDHIVIKYKYQSSNNTDNNFNDINNLDIQINENVNINDLNDEKKNNFEELHVSSAFSEFQLFQKAANSLLPQLIGWAKHY
ncbi:single-stranded DNA-binding protein [Plasmodium brasilianum]|uniref:Uncharacterized protein n=2 Tax=Plasmodium (Plasmodium) TaxID=418103 RepID=A0A1A8W3M5_PLAMA|nr:conserved Plasmodium protein, unknown function [Plasmodium malariae]KAI4837777.1 single-stranded DNA-binding protein [Plasmodium brasilianum]SBS86263.1 conserved Plasmodium protein, unknown function [Plasmodium malariae]SCN44780.1 conserved Plasmodium protein, unknown function [Plasmodium malariae]